MCCKIFTVLEEKKYYSSYEGLLHGSKLHRNFAGRHGLPNEIVSSTFLTTTDLNRHSFKQNSPFTTAFSYERLIVGTNKGITNGKHLHNAIKLLLFFEIIISYDPFKDV